MTFSGRSRRLVRAVAVSIVVLGCHEPSAPFTGPRIRVIGVADSTQRESFVISVVPPTVSTISLSPTSAVIRGPDMVARVLVSLRDARGRLLMDLINDSGDVVGAAGGRPVLWRADSDAPLDLDPTRSRSGILPTDINNRQEITLSTQTVWRNARIDTIVGRPGVLCRTAWRINDRGDVLIAGCGIYASPYTSWLIQLAAGGAYGGLCSGDRFSFPSAPNEMGWVLSAEENLSDPAKSRQQLVIRLSPDSCIRLNEVYDHMLVEANGFNNRGWIVGRRKTAPEAVLLVNSATIPLDMLVPDHGTWKFVDAIRVNDAGQILAEAEDVNTLQRAWFLLSPP